MAIELGKFRLPPGPETVLDWYMKQVTVSHQVWIREHAKTQTFSKT